MDNNDLIIDSLSWEQFLVVFAVLSSEWSSQVWSGGVWWVVAEGSMAGCSSWSNSQTQGSSGASVSHRWKNLRQSLGRPKTPRDPDVYWTDGKVVEDVDFCWGEAS